MQTSNTRSQRAKEMQAVIEKYHACDLTQRHFCKQEKLPLSTFTYWLRRCRRHDSPQANSSAALILLKLKQRSQKPSRPIVQSNYAAACSFIFMAQLIQA